MNDGELVQEVTEGRTAAYGELARRWSGRVLAMCHARTGRSAIAEELAQETLLRGFRSLATIENPHRFGSWICGIAHRVCLDWRKSKQSAEVSLEHGGRVPAGSADADQRVEQREEESRLLAEVARLPERLREVLLLYYYEDVTYQEISDQLDISVATVNARLSTARTLLRQRLEHPEHRQGTTASPERVLPERPPSGTSDDSHDRDVPV